MRQTTTDDELRSLRNEGYGGGYTANDVAELMTGCNLHVQAAFDHSTTLPPGIELCGPECYVNHKEAEAWIAQLQSRFARGRGVS